MVILNLIQILVQIKRPVNKNLLAESWMSGAESIKRDEDTLKY